MKSELDKFEKLLENSLADYKVQPSPNVWRRIAAHLFWGSTLFYALLTAVILLSGVLVSLLWNTGNNTKDMKQETPLAQLQEKEVDYPNDAEGEDAIKTDTITIAAKTPPHSDIHQVSNERRKEIPGAIHTSETNKVIHKKKSTFHSATKVQGSSILQETPSAGSQNNSASALTREYKLSPLSFLPADFFDLADNHCYFGKRAGVLFPNQAVHKPKLPIQIGAFVRPEFLFQKGEKTKKSLHIDILGKYGTDFFVQAGIGYAFSEDKGLFHIDYVQNDSVGYYQHVNSFTIGEDGKPVFNTSLETVYDSVRYTTDEEVKNSFSYLRVPVYFGYNIRKINRLRIDLKAGIIYSFLLNSITPGTHFENPKAIEVKIKDNSLIRRTAYHQFSIGISFHYQLTKRLSLSIEPGYHYFNQSIYRKQKLTPWSLSAGFGIIYRL